MNMTFDQWIEDVCGQVECNSSEMNQQFSNTEDEGDKHRSPYFRSVFANCPSSDETLLLYQEMFEKIN